MKNNNDTDYVIFICTVFLVGILFALTTKITDSLDNIATKIDDLEHDKAAIEPYGITELADPDLHTSTDAEEPTVIYKCCDIWSEKAQERSQELIEIKAKEIYPEELKEIPEASRTYLGVYELTAYEWTGNPCANGNYPSCGYTVASNTIPLGSRIYIEGYGEYVVEDRGGMAGNVIDVYMGDYESCIQFGRRSANVYLID